MKHLRPLLFAAALLSGYLTVHAAQPAPAPFSPLESARLDALAQEGRALEAEQRTLALLKERWQGKVAAFKAEAEKVRPGFTWDAESGKWSAVPEVKK